MSFILRLETFPNKHFDEFAVKHVFFSGILKFVNRKRLQQKSSASFRQHIKQQSNLRAPKHLWSPFLPGDCKDRPSQMCWVDLGDQKCSWQGNTSSACLQCSDFPCLLSPVLCLLPSSLLCTQDAHWLCHYPLTGQEGAKLHLGTAVKQPAP